LAGQFCCIRIDELKLNAKHGAAGTNKIVAINITALK